MKHWLLLLALLGACGAEPPPRPVVAQARIRDAGAVAPVVDAGDPLAVEPASLAPGMREVVKADISTSKNFEIPTEADTCVRVAVRSLSPVKVKLSSKSGTTFEGSTIGEKGPVCVRKGDALTLDVTTDAKTRVVVWASP